MKIQLLAGIGGFPTGSVHRVIQIIPHGGHTDDPHQYLIQGQVFVPASKAIVVADVTPGKLGDAELMGDAFLAAWYRGENEILKEENARLRADLYALRDDWENALLTISSLEGEIADLRFEADKHL